MNTLILHCHMPKTAGSALNRSVLFPRHAAARRRLLYGVAFERVRRFPLGEHRPPVDAEILAGHVPVGFADNLGRDVLHVSVLRDPVDRMFSFLNYVAVAPRHGLRRRFDVDMQCLARTDPAAFVRMMLDDGLVRLRQTNVMTRLAGGMARLGRKSPDASHLDAAMRRIRRGGYEVGVQEEFPAFVRRLTERLDCAGLGEAGSSTAMSRSDKAEKRLPHVISRADATPSLISAIAEANDLDRRFYDHVYSRNVCGAA